MKTSKENVLTTAIVRILDSVNCQILILALALGAPVAAGAAATGKTFATPEAAVSALMAAASAWDSNALRVVLGPAAADLENPDHVQATNEFGAFASALNQTHRIVRESDSKCVLEVGANYWPFPVPIVKKDGQWFFDTAEGKEELLNRRIGNNELSTLQSVRAFVEAQREYATKDRDGDEVLEYAQKLSSSQGQTDGLYWPPSLNGEISPLGPLVAYAQAEGYTRIASTTDDGPQPFHGYFFRMLDRQGKHAPGGKYDYVINGNMIGGFALVAWPAEYGDSGVMTFIVNQQGRVLQRDLGKNTEQIARKMNAYDPDPAWHVSAD